ncbi:long-chain-acyl-CoA synthetase [Phenylobacterium sp.]|uniref:long-chain-acyl-CoA synthetase n=1 Tax=Phenylobacterium sp. TaxID=1871053 RepID=UPI0025EB6F7E|nr:long-chain-acyl-CoA synthetase [Phenylobacterium sp.]MBX3484205.1 long-chain-acyl-CoA synthetase [Phenylobacterium sp.]MCW5761226.1 long-chain-acyl-CoA synthetase [Phenylobacterium sp.]
MRLQARIKRDLKFWQGLRRTLKRVKSIARDSDNLICDDLQAAVEQHRARPAMTFEGRTVTYGELDAMANRYAHWAKGLNIRRGQVVALFMPNRLEYFAVWYGLSKVGVVTALINNQLSGMALAHSLNISGAGHIVVDPETSPVLGQAKALLERTMHEWVLGPAQGDQRDLVQALKSCSQLPPDRSVREDMTAADTALLIYTSGTTGLPKAARIAHMRVQLYMRGFAGATDARAADRIYVALPLYHATGGLCALGAALLNGGSVVLKRKFSASQFWGDIVSEGCTMFVYIGELCRYLVNHAPDEDETRHRIRLAFGNGLRPDVWPVMKQRFRIPEILEFYGSTEGNVSAFNFDGREGAIGRVPRWMKKQVNFRLVQFDVEAGEVVRGLDGLCIECGPGQVGQCVGRIAGDARSEFSGYLDKAASEKKVIQNVFERGDAWFATGDLMRMDAEGYVYFVDRIGDTFRWKGENVSTSEVEGRLQAFPGVAQATVFGVEVDGADGRAGMAALVLDGAFDATAFGEHVKRELPGYAQPLFLRILPAMDTTGTFKIRKMDLVKDGYDPARIKGPLFFHDPRRGYVKLTRSVFDRLAAGAVKI